MSENRLHIVYLTPGAGGMFCGSCLNDNMLAAAMTRDGHSVCLLPIYTPIVTDEADVSVKKLFYGGVNVYLQERVPLFRYLPRFLDRFLDRPSLVRKLAGRAVGLEARQLGALTLSIVRGEHGHQRKEVHRLVDWLAAQPRPDVVNLSNYLIAGCIPAIRRRLPTRIVVTLQGDDLFLNDLPQPYRSQVIEELRKLNQSVDCFIVNSRFYADAMAELFDIPADRFAVVPLGISLAGYPPSAVKPADHRPPTIGYLARVCPAKGFHALVDAFLQLKSQPGLETTQLALAGWLGDSDRAYFEKQRKRIAAAGYQSDLHYAGAVDREQKIAFLQSVDVLSVPTTYREPKGRFVLEALASGVPVVLPDHGAFPEILSRTGGGKLARPNDTAHLAELIGDLLRDADARRRLGREGQAAVIRTASAEAAARETIAVYRRCLAGS